MADCKNLEKCGFFQIKPDDQKQELALMGFMKLYCKGPKQTECYRRLVGTTLGGPDKIPKNMLPNGLPHSGTDDSGWSPEVKDLINKARVEKWKGQKNASCSPSNKNKKRDGEKK